MVYVSGWRMRGVNVGMREGEMEGGREAGGA